MFDALTSRRPDKDAWTNGAAVAFMKEQAGHEFDPQCVEALPAQEDAIRMIRRRFEDTPSAP